MNHQFSVELACKFGVNEAIFIENLRFWIAKNKANRKHFHHGRYWTYNSALAYAELFPYFSRNQIERIIAKLRGLGVLLVSNFNENQYDRTNWYSIKEEMLSSESRNGNSEIEESLIDTDINTDTGSHSGVSYADAEQPALQKKASIKPDEVSEEVWSAFQQIRKAKKAPITELVIRKLKEQALQAGWTLEEALQECVVRGWQSFKADWVPKKQTDSGKPNRWAGGI